jgi:hypothetical protein
MSEGICAGIEYGDLEFRVAYADEERVLSLPLLAEASGPSVIFDPMANISSLGVGFPTIMQSLASGIPFMLGERKETAESVIQQRLTSIRQTLFEVTGRPVDETVLAVATAFTGRKREALLECVKTAGFPKASLIDTCTAAAVGHQGYGDEPSTVLVYRLSYGDCDYSLVRLARRRCWVVGSGFVPGVSGERLDALTMEAIVLALRKERIFLGLKQFSSRQWHGLRKIAETARGLLAQQPEAVVTLTSDLTGLESAIDLRFSAARFSAAVRPMVEKTIDSVHTLLEDKGLELANVDHFLLLGDDAIMAPVFDILAQGFRGRPKPANPDVVARGAVLYACQFAERTIEPGPLREEPAVGTPAVSAAPTQAAPPATRAISEEAGNFVEIVEPKSTVIARPQLSEARAPEPPEALSLATVRQLVQEGRHEEAKSVLDAIDREVDALRRELRKNAPTGPQLLIQQARRMLADRQYLEAIAVTHKAYEQAQDDPAVFAGMMKIHADVGLAMDKPEEYETAVQILGCAHSHDQTDRTIHQALSQRHFLHALAMKRLNNLSKALDVAQLALSFDPKHREANELLEKLMGLHND